VSVGAVNPYGLPSRLTLERLTSGGARVFLTDTDGDLSVRPDHSKLAVLYRGLSPGQRPP